MKKYVLVRIMYMMIAIALIVSITFLLLEFMPGSPFNDLRLTPEQRVLLDEKYGLNDPIAVKYARYVGNLFHGDLGTSFIFNNQNVSDMIAARMSSSILVGLQALVCGSVVGILLGIEVILKHAVRNALIPVVTILGPMTVTLITGSTVVERIFSVPGLGNLLVTSIQSNDYFVILGEGLVFSLMFLSVVLVVDILYGLIDPRIRLTGGNSNE